MSVRSSLDAVGCADLRENAQAQAPQLQAHVGSVEQFLQDRRRSDAITVIVDPPRTGLSKVAADAIIRHAPRRIVYVSCDAPTLARDARRLLDAGYHLSSLRAFDFFPNTPHVESLAIFDVTA